MCLLLPYQLSYDMKIILTAGLHSIQCVGIFIATSRDSLGKPDRVQSLRCRTKRETNRPQPESAQPTSPSIDEPAKSSKSQIKIRSVKHAAKPQSHQYHKLYAE
ncbi:TPA: hypothetical protein ACH3X3_001143 [Trebouxia sp. C0006]